VIVAGAAVTVVSNLIVLAVASRLMRLSPAQTCGVIAGVSTQPAVFAYASQNARDDNGVHHRCASDHPAPTLGGHP
jgi:uncharacterized transporter YbjL